MKTSNTAWFLARWLGQVVGTLALWTVWLALTILVALQIFVVASPEFTVPQSMLRPWEDRLAFAGLRVSFDQVRFDPSGRIAVDKLQVFSTTFAEPIATVENLYVETDPWLLSIGEFEPRLFQATGVDLFVPAMFSGSGQREAIGRGFSFSADFTRERIELASLNGRVGKLSVHARGGLTSPRAVSAQKTNPREAVDAALRSFFQLGRHISSHLHELNDVEEPRLELTLTPSPTRIATVQAYFTATAAHLEPRRFNAAVSWKERLDARRIRAKLALPLTGNTPYATQVEVAVDRLESRPLGIAENLHVVLNASVNATSVWFDPRTCAISCGRYTAGKYRLEALGAALQPRLPDRVSGELYLRAAGGTWLVGGETNFTQKRAHLRLEGAVTSELIALAGDRLGRDLSKIVAPSEPPHLSVELGLKEGWKFDGLSGTVRAGPTEARNVAVDRASGRFRFAAQQLTVEDIALQQKGNHAAGSYTMNTETQDYRFLLRGHIQPPDIAGWFGAWWPRFWRHFDFSQGGPIADVDVTGRWGFPYLSTVFVEADCRRPTIRGVPFERVRTVLFIRPDFYDGLEVAAWRPEGEARGTFTRRVDLQKDAFRSMDFDVVSSLDVREGAKLFGESGLEIVAPFTFEKAPRLKIVGHLDGPAAPGGQHDQVDVRIESTGALTFYDFPLNDLSARARLEGEILSIGELQVGVAGGTATGTARRTGKSGERRLAFDCMTTGVNLGEAIRTGENFAAKRRGQPPPPESKFQQRLATGKLQVTLKAEGPYNNAFGYEGEGSAEIAGAELADVNLLGALSQALRGIGMNFTSVRLDTARAHFFVQSDRLIFDDVRLNGPTAAVEAKGYYRLDQKIMDFNATVRPFEEGKTLLANAVDFVLTPVSAALQLRLTGSLDKPNWRFAYGPTSLLRKLSGTEETPNSTVPPGSSNQPPQPPPYLRR